MAATGDQSRGALDTKGMVVAQNSRARECSRSVGPLGGARGGHAIACRGLPELWSTPRGIAVAALGEAPARAGTGTVAEAP